MQWFAVIGLCCLAGLMVATGQQANSTQHALATVTQEVARHRTALATIHTQQSAVSTRGGELVQEINDDIQLARHQEKKLLADVKAANQEIVGLKNQQTQMQREFKERSDHISQFMQANRDLQMKLATAESELTVAQNNQKTAEEEKDQAVADLTRAEEAIKRTRIDYGQEIDPDLTTLLIALDSKTMPFSFIERPLTDLFTWHNYGPQGTSGRLCVQLCRVENSSERYFYSVPPPDRVSYDEIDAAFRFTSRANVEPAEVVPDLNKRLRTTTEPIQLILVVPTTANVPKFDESWRDIHRKAKQTHVLVLGPSLAPPKLEEWEQFCTKMGNGDLLHWKVDLQDPISTSQARGKFSDWVNRQMMRKTPGQL